MNLQSAAGQDAEGVSAAPIESADSAAARSIVQRINDALEPVDSFFGDVNGYIAEVIFFKVPLGGGDTVPAAVLVLLLGATFFTFRMGFINVRGFRHAIMVTAGKYDNPDDQGEVTHFQALTAALSATVGLGNIAGVAIAIGTGGPGATLWLILAGFIGMSSKFVECTLGQKYREVRPDGRIMGGAMYYLSRGLPELGLGGLGKFLAIMFAILCVGGSFAGGNSFQVKMSLDAVAQTLPFLAAPEVAGAADYRWIYGLLMAIVTGMVIIGGIRRIASAAEKIVP
ncbi:MAG: alanine:cation symporter family protein, partial [Fuerstiella sp.]